MHFYFSHSYRDFSINAYFVKCLMDENIDICADQKSDTWCVAKLERYLSEAAGFISVIPNRMDENAQPGYSPYIGHELDLARRARVPRLLFVEEEVLALNPTRFPNDAISFSAQSPDEDLMIHRVAIKKFLQSTSDPGFMRRPQRRPSKIVTMVNDALGELNQVGNHMVELLHREGFSIKRLNVADSSVAIDDIGILESMWNSDLCVFLLGKTMSSAHIALAMAHAHCIPSMRFQFDEEAAQCEPTLQGLIRFGPTQNIVHEFNKQLQSFLRGFVEPVTMAREGSVLETLRSVGTTQWQAEQKNLWEVADGHALIRHVATDDPLIRDSVVRARKMMHDVAHKRGREYEFACCHTLYEQLKKRRFSYEFEDQSGTPRKVQKIRSPRLVFQSSAATCIDLTCLFAAELEAFNMFPVILIIKIRNNYHALIGYRADSEPAWESPNLGVVRRALAATDAVFFEATGAIEADSPVFMETPEERQDKQIDFATAILVAERIIKDGNVELVHLLDVRMARERST